MTSTANEDLMMQRQREMRSEPSPPRQVQLPFAFAEFYDRIIESLRLEKTSKIKSNHQPIITVPAKPCPEKKPYSQLEQGEVAPKRQT